MNRFAPFKRAACLLLCTILWAAVGCGVPAPPPTVAELRERAVGGDADAVKGLVEKLGRASTTTTRSEAYLALLECGDGAKDAALTAARDADPVRREHALALPEVVRFYHVAGPIDFLVHVWTRDSEHLRNLAMTAFTSREEVSHIETELIFEHVSCQELPSFIDEPQDS